MVEGLRTAFSVVRFSPFTLTEAQEASNARARQGRPAVRIFMLRIVSCGDGLPAAETRAAARWFRPGANRRLSRGARLFPLFRLLQARAAGRGRWSCSYSTWRSRRPRRRAG